MFGKICLEIMRKLLKPKARAAVTYCISFALIIWPLTTLATSTHIVKPTAINTCQKPFPNAKVIAITNKSVGMDQVTFIIHIIKASTLPPK